MTSHEFDVLKTHSEHKRFESYKETRKWKGKTILIVEDVPSNFQLLEAYFSRTGMNIIHVENGLEAIEVMKSPNAIDLIIMDIRLPKLNGIRSTQEIRKFRPDIPIIAQTAFAMDSDKELCIQSGCDAFLSKPFLKQELFDIIEYYIS
ncbi:MAG: response regulator [Bacteroidetes bacterium HGW-Bacteroidetes-1]|jgi:CheY-like chemotaxis protein|nr:MAG: response regulator [Bacteroidetes bacterium HGW-Bacteroidetes-1]